MNSEFTTALDWTQVRRQRPCVVALGNFDGVHLGHRRILDALLKESRAAQLDAVLITFEPHPRYYFKPNDKPSLLTTPWEKLDLLRAWPVEVLPLAFNKNLADLEPEVFIESFLKDRLQGRKFLLGHDHRFGKKARGDAKLLQAHVADPSDVIILEPFVLNGQVVSSSAIRAHLEAARIEEANTLLGRPFTYGGKVVHGEGRGRQLGIPTANLDIKYPFKVIASYGVYGGRARVNGKDYPAIANIGKNPTFDGDKVKIEIHILDFKEDVYDTWLEFSLLFHVRAEKKFSSVAELRAQIESDIALTRNRLAQGPL